METNSDAKVSAFERQAGINNPNQKAHLGQEIAVLHYEKTIQRT